MQFSGALHSLNEGQGFAEKMEESKVIRSNERLSMFKFCKPTGLYFITLYIYDSFCFFNRF